MRILISPAKTFRKDALPVLAGASQPVFAEQAAKLMSELRSLDAEELVRIMDISDDLARETAERHSEWGGPFHPGNARNAVLAFHGEVYKALGADRWNASDLDFAQERLRIVSGLYGLLRPLDLIQEYRLEMGGRWSPKKEASLYAYWSDSLARALKDEAGDVPIINLASQEYFKAIDHDNLSGRVVHIQFREQRGDTYKLIGTYAKTARGRMARFLIQERVDSVDAIRDFSEDGYAFNPSLSDDALITFTRTPLTP